MGLADASGIIVSQLDCPGSWSNYTVTGASATLVYILD